MKLFQSCPALCDSVDIPSMEFSTPEDWNGKPFPSPRDLPNPGSEARSPTLQADSLPPGKPVHFLAVRLIFLV